MSKFCSHKCISLICVFIVILFTVLNNSILARPTALPFHAKNKDFSIISKVENHLNSIRTLHAHFTQTSSNGSVATGVLYLKRPGKLRINYALPNTLQIIANGTWLIFLDEKLKEINQLPLRASPASVLLQNNLQLLKGFPLLRMSENKDIMEIRINNQEDNEKTKLTLLIAKSSLDLLGWSILDTQGIKTRVILDSPKFNQPIKPSFFEFIPPDWAFPAGD